MSSRSNSLRPLVLRRVLAALVITGALASVTLAPVGASVAAKSLCDTIRDGDVGAPAPPQSSSATAADAKKSLKLYKKFASSDAPKPLKKALATIVSTLKKLAAGAEPTELWGTDVSASAYGKAADKVGGYVVDKCVKDVIDDLPGDVDVPDVD